MTISYNSDPEYAGQKLTDSMVSFNGKPVYIHSVDGEGTVTYGYVGKSGHFTCKLEELDLTPFPLGYVNRGRNTTYCCRLPARFYKQGLRQNLVASFGSGGQVDVNSNSLVQTILGQFPKLSACIDRIGNEEATRMAFHRHFCVGKLALQGYSLYYKDVLVGWITPSNGNYAVSYKEGCDYVREYIEEVLNV